MRKRNGVLMRQLAAAIYLSALAIAAMVGAIGTAGAADLPEAARSSGRTVVDACAPKEDVILFDWWGTPTPPARTPYFTCVTGTVLLPGQIPPPPEYCCS
jgi:hypothetical protein